MDAETLHDLRVELKRVRFLKNVLRENGEKKNKLDKAYKPFKNLFSQLGKIRGQHVNLYRLNSALKHNIEPIAQKHFHNKREKLERKLNETLSKNVDSLRTGMIAMESLVEQILEWEEASFVQSLKKQVRKRINKKTPDEKFHPVRHILKAVVYSSEISSSMAEAIGKIFNMDVVVNLEDAIGDWHDLSILLKGKSGKLLTKKAKKRINKKKKTERKRIKQLIPELFLNPQTF